MYSVAKGDASQFIDALGRDVVYVLAIGNTKTAEIPGITVAGASPELIKYTPPADAELLYCGRCLSIDSPPATPDGKPTPALLSYTALRLTKIATIVVDAGLIVKPKIPYVSLDAPVGGNIAKERAMDRDSVERVIERSRLLGEQLSKIADIVVVGESIPAGTTTAAAVLKALGLKPAVSSSMPENPVELKMRVVEEAVKRVEGDDPIEIIAAVGDPVMAAVVGIATGCRKVLLAGGTQMVAISNLISKLADVEMAMATTCYVANDPSADIAQAACPVIVADPQLARSRYEGLRAYAEGFVKEGVGAGALTLIAYARGTTPDRFLREVEKDYERIVLSKS